VTRDGHLCCISLFSFSLTCLRMSSLYTSFHHNYFLLCCCVVGGWGLFLCLSFVERRCVCERSAVFGIFWWSLLGAVVFCLPFTSGLFDTHTSCTRSLFLFRTFCPLLLLLFLYKCKKDLCACTYFEYVYLFVFYTTVLLLRTYLVSGIV